VNWLGDLIQKEVYEDDTVLSLGCGIMQAILDVIPTYPKTRLQCRKLVGVDAFEPYLKFLEERGTATVQWDLTKTPYPFDTSSFDVVLLLDVLEHLTQESGSLMLPEAARIARKKIIVFTPAKFDKNKKGVKAYRNLGLPDNVLQKHLSFWSANLLAENFGFKVQFINKGVYGVREKANFEVKNR